MDCQSKGHIPRPHCPGVACSASCNQRLPPAPARLNALRQKENGNTSRARLPAALFHHTTDVFHHPTPPSAPPNFSLPPLPTQPLSSSSSGPSSRNARGSGVQKWWNGGVMLSNDAFDESTLSLSLITRDLLQEPHTRATVKTLIRLRLRLSTESLSWLETFLVQHDGLDVLEKVMSQTYKPLSSDNDQGNEKKCRPLQAEELDGPIHLELIKCLRVIMNADLGFERVLQKTVMLRWLVSSSFAPSPSYKARIHAAEILSAICRLSPEYGRPAVRQGFLSLTSNPNRAFFSLVESLGAERTDELRSRTGRIAIPETIEADLEDPNLVWEYRCRAMGLCNAIVNGETYWHDLFVDAEISDAVKRVSELDPPAAFLDQVEIWNANFTKHNSPSPPLLQTIIGIHQRYFRNLVRFYLKLFLSTSFECSMI